MALRTGLRVEGALVGDGTSTVVELDLRQTPLTPAVSMKPDAVTSAVYVPPASNPTVITASLNGWKVTLTLPSALASPDAGQVGATFVLFLAYNA